MASDRRVQSSRTNAKKSTGPRTSAGKARSRLNAIKHGLRSVAPPAGYLERIKKLADAFCNNDPFPYWYDAALELAEGQAMQERIRSFRTKVLEQISARGRDQSNVAEQLLTLNRLERYERSALAQKRRAIRRFDALRDD
jgi:hypothetical protein